MASRVGNDSVAVSLDQVRLIRRCRRCFAYGCVGLLPVLGSGVAYQAVQIRRQVCLELGENPLTPAVPAFVVVGLLLLWASDRAWGLAGDATVALIILALQSYTVWRSLCSSPSQFRRGRRELTVGVTLAYAGLATTAWSIGVLALRVASAFPSP
jgi:hypothetical protein